MAAPDDIKEKENQANKSISLVLSRSAALCLKTNCLAKLQEINGRTYPELQTGIV